MSTKLEDKIAAFLRDQSDADLIGWTRADSNEWSDLSIRASEADLITGAARPMEFRYNFCLGVAAELARRLQQYQIDWANPAGEQPDYLGPGEIVWVTTKDGPDIGVQTAFAGDVLSRPEDYVAWAEFDDFQPEPFTGTWDEEVGHE